MKAAKKEKLRKTGLDIIGDVSWGTHLCVFYESKEDLLDILVPYFKAGLENNEFCMWITSEALTKNDAQEAMRKAVPDFDRFLNKGQIEIIPYDNWYLKDGVFELKRVITAWVDRLNNALAKGYDGMRITGNTGWLEKKDWQNFKDYEEEINSVIGGYKMMAICTYSLSKCGASEIMDVMVNHQFAIIRKEGKWSIVESAERKKAEEKELKLLKDLIAICDNIPFGIAYLDKDYMYISVNKFLTDIIGCREEELIGKKCYEITGEYAADPAKKGLEKICSFCKLSVCMETGSPVVIERPLEGRIIKVVSIPEFDANGNIYRFLEIVEDITERKKAEEEIKNLAKFPEENLNPVYRTSKDGVLLYANLASRRLILEDQTKIGDKIPEKWIGMIKNAYDSGKKQQVELEFNGRAFLFDLIPVIEGGYVNSYATDITKRKQAEEELKKSASTLKEQKIALEQKNLALKEMIEHIERTKNKTKEDIAINVDETLMPIVEKLKRKGASPKYVKLFQYHLKELSSSFGRKITQKSAKLTPREIEICNMLRGGLSSKDLAELLNVSCQTIEKHRKNIRKKLGLSNKKANLVSYLQKA